ncbi:MAG: PucR family transcriptional regulator [Angelakisella sp.]|nr:PucR family transcriptional regulator [Angelakisella sp.]
MFTIADLLKLPDIQGIRLLAGAGGVENEISRTNIMDNPDTFDWLISGEVLLSTGYIFREDEELQRRLIHRVAEIGCAGMAIKTNRYLSAVPPCMIQEAERLGFPLLELPYGHSLSTISEIVSKQIYQPREDRFAQTMAIQRQLTMASLKPGSLQEIARIAVGCMNDPILILDSNWRLLAWEDCPSNPFPLEQILAPRRKAAVLPREFTQGMPKTLDMFRKPITRHYSLDNGHQIICRVVPVAVFDSGTYGYLVVWETVRTLDADDYMTLEQIAVSVAIERIRVREMEEVKVRMRRDFFDDLLSGNIESLSAIRSLAELHGIKPDIPYRCLLVRYAWEEAGGSGQPASKLDTNAELCAELCTRTAKSLGAPVIAIPHSVHVVLLFGVPGQDREDNIRQYTEELHEALSAHFSPGNLLIVVSGVVENITRIAEAYRDVQSLSRVLRGTGPLGSPVFVEDYSVFYLLEKYVDRQDLADFAQKALGELMAYDSENHSHLLQTLDVYFSRSGSITEVAKQMYIHRNTCVYRLEKIKAILHDDFSNPMKLLRYQIALLALKIIEH